MDWTVGTASYVVEIIPTQTQHYPPELKTIRCIEIKKTIKMKKKQRTKHYNIVFIYAIGYTCIAIWKLAFNCHNAILEEYRPITTVYMPMTVYMTG